MKGLRGTALLAVGCGHVAAMTAGVVPAWVLLPVLVVTAAGAWVSDRVTGSSGVSAGALRAGATVVCLLLALVLLPQALGAEGDDGPRGVLGPLLVGVMVAQSWTWTRRRELGTALLGAVGLLVLAASFAPDVLVGLPILVGWVAVVAGVVLLDRDRLSDGSDAVAVAVGAGAPPRSTVVVPTALAAALGLAAFLLVPVPEEAGLQSRLAQQAQQALGSGRAAAGAYSGPRVDLRVRGDLDDDPLIEVPDDSPSLWGSGVYDTWDGSGWTTTEERRRVVGPPFVVQRADGPTRTDQVRVERRARGVVWAPGPVVSVDLPSRVVQVDGYGSVRGDTGTGYEVTSVERVPSDEALRRAAGVDEADPRWLALPSSLPERVRALGRDLAAGALAGGDRDVPGGSAGSDSAVAPEARVDVVRAVERYLAETARYDLDSPVPGPGEDAVDRFLFVDRVGFCEQFAAAEVLLLRAAGIPARFATGLAYGVPSGERRTFRESDLHAWVEVFHPGVGWVASDPTPPSTQLASASLRVRVAARLTSWLRAADDVPGGRPALALAVLVLTTAAALLRRRRPQSGRGARLPEPVGRPALTAYLRYDARLGPLRRLRGESLAEHGARLPVDDAVRRALQDVERECYAPQPPITAAESARVLESAPPA